jgi:hypothetical protein
MIESARLWSDSMTRKLILSITCPCCTPLLHCDQTHASCRSVLIVPAFRHRLDQEGGKMEASFDGRRVGKTSTDVFPTTGLARA